MKWVSKQCNKLTNNGTYTQLRQRFYPGNPIHENEKIYFSIFLYNVTIEYVYPKISINPRSVNPWVRIQP